VCYYDEAIKKHRRLAERHASRTPLTTCNQIFSNFRSTLENPKILNAFHIQHIRKQLTTHNPIFNFLLLRNKRSEYARYYVPVHLELSQSVLCVLACADFLLWMVANPQHTIQTRGEVPRAGSRLHTVGPRYLSLGESTLQTQKIQFEWAHMLFAALPPSRVFSYRYVISSSVATTVKCVRSLHLQEGQSTGRTGRERERETEIRNGL